MGFFSKLLLLSQQKAPLNFSESQYFKSSNLCTILNTFCLKKPGSFNFLTKLILYFEISPILYQNEATQLFVSF